MKSTHHTYLILGLMFLIYAELDTSGISAAGRVIGITYCVIAIINYFRSKE